MIPLCVTDNFASGKLVGPLQPQSARKHLESHLAVERDLSGFVDDAHASTAELAEEFEIAETLGYHWAHRIRRGPASGFRSD